MKKIIIKQNFVERLRLIFENLIKGRIHLYIINIDNEEVSAELLVRYFLIRLRQSYTIRFMLNPVEKELKKLVKLGYLQGFRIRLSGRFTRRQRSKIIKTKFGIMPLTEKRKKIDFNERTTILKFSILSIRV
jgi:ribosomal protein S3